MVLKYVPWFCDIRICTNVIFSIPFGCKWVREIRLYLQEMFKGCLFNSAGQQFKYFSEKAFHNILFPLIE